MTVVVSDASPVLNLASIDRLLLLRDMFGTILVPATVWSEVVAGEPLTRPIWIELRSPTNLLLVKALQLDVDPGEAEAIALAKEVAADLVLIDEKKGRAVAKRLGLRYLGLLGVLVEAKQRGLIDELKPILDLLIQKAGFRVSQTLYGQVLASVGE
jgi:uncharacterized protein